MLSQLKNNYPDISFEASDDFTWEPSSKTVYYNPKNPDASALLLHEISHAILGHDQYKSDIDLIKIERAAWQKAESISIEYRQTISHELVESTLDSYRDWLHSRSTCPSCSAVGIQSRNDRYKCPACSHEWRVNEARSCRLMRYKI